METTAGEPPSILDVEVLMISGTDTMNPKLTQHCSRVWPNE